MDEQGVRAALQHYLDRSAAGDEDAAHEIYHPDAILEFREAKVARETIYVMDGWEAPEWRARWWAQPPIPPAAG